MNRIYLFALIAIAGTSFQQASAQVNAFSGSTTSSGMFGSRSLGQGISGGGSSAFGGTPGNMVEQAQSGAGQVQGGERFTREGRDAAAFVGADSGDSANFFGQTQGLAGSGLEQFLSRAAQRDFQNQAGAGGSSSAPLRPALSLGFSPPVISSAVFNARISDRLSRLPNLEILEPVSVGLSDRTAILQGRVASERDREMIAQLLMLEPGVSAVQNDLQVGAPNLPPTPVAPKSVDSAVDSAGPTATPIPPPIPDEQPWLPDASVVDEVSDELPAPPTAPNADG